MDKVKPSTSRTVTYYTYSDTRGQTNNLTTTYQTGEDRISYDDGERLPSGHWPWKRCVHTTSNYLQPILATEGYSLVWPRERPPYSRTVSGVLLDTSSAPSAPTRNWDQSTLQAVLDQVDLNSTENVLLYSGIVQAVPLLGSVFKLNSILRRLSKKLSKGLRKKPFTTVLKTAISLDFIDRFVISPTLDDARKFQDACDYVLRVIQTARDRNAHRFALKSSSTEVISESESTSWRGVSGDLFEHKVLTKRRQTVTSKAFMLLEARYDLLAIDPIKFWAQRVGLTRPLDSVWDLVPFSFVVDYFTRAGDFIDHLSDKMSDVEGLRGRITAIHDLWGTLLCQGERTSEVVKSQGGPWVPSDARMEGKYIRPGRSTCRNTYFSRFHVSDPWSALSSLQRDENWGKLNLSLSSTRKRTIAELIIQAKL